MKVVSRKLVELSFRMLGTITFLIVSLSACGTGVNTITFPCLSRPVAASWPCWPCVGFIRQNETRTNTLRNS